MATSSPAVPATGPSLTDLVAAVRQVIGARASWAETAQLVADALRTHLPSPDILTPDQRPTSPGSVPAPGVSTTDRPVRGGDQSWIRALSTRSSADR